MVQRRSYSNCTEVNLECPVEATIYGYYPSLGGNAFFIAFFALFGAANLIIGLRYRTYTYALAMTLAGTAEAIGYVGRVILHSNPYSETGFDMQICCLIIAPAFNSAAIYLVLKHVTLCFGERWSRIKPRLYTYIFITGDLISLVLQAVGGAMAATAHDDRHQQDTGDNLMMAGISFQVVTLFFFGVAALDYLWRRRRASEPLSFEAAGMMSSLKFRCFALGLTAAFVAVFVRCVYRIVEMAGGWQNPVMQNEASFIVLDGCMVAIATLMQTIFHPGYCFPRLSSRYVVPTATDSSTKAEGEMTFETKPEFLNAQPIDNL